MGNGKGSITAGLDPVLVGEELGLRIQTIVGSQADPHVAGRRLGRTRVGDGQGPSHGATSALRHIVAVAPGGIHEPRVRPRVLLGLGLGNGVREQHGAGIGGPRRNTVVVVEERTVDLAKLRSRGDRLGGLGPLVVAAPEHVQQVRTVQHAAHELALLGAAVVVFLAAKGEKHSDVLRAGAPSPGIRVAPVGRPAVLANVDSSVGRLLDFLGGAGDGAAVCPVCLAGV